MTRNVITIAFGVLIIAAIAWAGNLGQAPSNAPLDISDYTNLTAGDALTLTDDNIDFDGGATPGGELGGTWASPTVDSGIHDDEYIELGDSFSGDVTGAYNSTDITESVLGVGGTDTIFPADPDADKYLMWDDNPGNLSWETPTGGGNDVYVEEGDAAKVDSSTADLYIDFDNGDFDVGTVGNEANITVNDGGINHDSTTNFDANEHIDWTSDQGATNIHSGNYTDTDTNLTQEEVDDFVNALLLDADAVHTLITLTYDDANDAFDFVVDNDLANYDNTNSGFYDADSDVDHDSTTNFVANEHIDWTGVDFLTGSATALTANEIVAGTTPQGELGGTWASPTVDSGIHDDEYVELGDSFSGDVTGAYNSTAISAGVIIETDLDGDNAPADEDYLQYDSTGTNFVWRSPAELLQDASGDASAAFDWNWQELQKASLHSGTDPSALSPAAGDYAWYFHTNLNILFLYDGSSAWTPVYSPGNVTLYVDSDGGGADDLAHGHAYGSDAFVTIEYAVETVCKGLHNGNIVIYVDAPSDTPSVPYTAASTTTYTAGLTFEGITFTGDYTLKIYGALVQETTATLDSATQGTGATQGTLTDTGEFGSYDNYLVETSGGTKIIDSDTADVLTITGCFTSTPTGTYTVYSWGTIIAGATNQIYIQNNQRNVYFYYCDIRGASVNKRFAYSWKGANLTYFYYCTLRYRARVADGSFMYFYYCYIDGLSIDAVLCQNFGTAFLYYTKATTLDGWYVLRAQTSSNLTISGGTILDDSDYGIYLQTNSTLYSQGNSPAIGYNRITNQDDYGIRVEGGAQAWNESNNIQYSNNGTDESYQTTNIDGHDIPLAWIDTS